MTRNEYNVFCADLPQSTHVIQWGNADVWKVGGKVYTICSWTNGAAASTFKVSHMALEILPDLDGIRPLHGIARTEMGTARRRTGIFRRRAAQSHHPLLRDDRGQTNKKETRQIGVG